MIFFETPKQWHRQSKKIGAEPEEKIAPLQWIKLFNGKDLNNWRIKIKDHAYKDNFANTFRVTGGSLAVGYDGYGNFDEQFGHIFYKEKFSSYLLSLEYRFVGEQATGGAGWAYRNSVAIRSSSTLCKVIPFWSTKNHRSAEV